MGLAQVFKDKMFEAMIAKDENTKDTYRTLLGEVQLMSQRAGVDLPDDKIVALVKKTIENNIDTIKLINKQVLAQEDGSPFQHNLFLLEEKYVKEVELLKQYLPVELSLEDTRKDINTFYLHSITNSKSDGQAIGVVIKGFKERGLVVNANHVKDIVLELRKNNVPSL